MLAHFGFFSFLFFNVTAHAYVTVDYKVYNYVTADCMHRLRLHVLK